MTKSQISALATLLKHGKLYYNRQRPAGAPLQSVRALVEMGLADFVDQPDGRCAEMLTPAGHEMARSLGL